MPRPKGSKNKAKVAIPARVYLKTQKRPKKC